MKYHSAFHTENTGSCSYFVPFQIPQFAFSETEIKPQPKFSQLIPAVLAPSHALLTLQRIIFVPGALKCLSYLPSLLTKTESLCKRSSKAARGRTNYFAIVLNYFAIVLNLVKSIPIFNLEIPLPTARMPQNGFA